MGFEISRKKSQTLWVTKNISNLVIRKSFEECNRNRMKGSREKFIMGCDKIWQNFSIKKGDKKSIIRSRSKELPIPKGCNRSNFE